MFFFYDILPMSLFCVSFTSSFKPNGNYFRYSLVAASFDDEDEEESTINDSTDSDVSKTLRNQNRQSNLKHSKTYESELDLVLEDLSESDTATIQSDTESVHSLRLAKRDDCSNDRTEIRTRSLTSTTSSLTSTTRSLTSTTRSLTSTNSSINCNNEAGRSTPPPTDQMLRYRLLNGCSKYQKLPQSTDSLTNSASLEEDHSRGCKSLPRNLKHCVSTSHFNGLISTLDKMGSLPRKLTYLNTELKKDSNSRSPVRSATDDSISRTAQQSVQHSKRRSLSPGKFKSAPATNEKAEKIHKLIEEARRMSSIADSPVTSAPSESPPIKQAFVASASTCSPIKPPGSDIDLVSPYASSDVINSPPLDADYFRRKPSYKIACSSQVTPRKVTPRPHSEDAQQMMKRNYSYRQANRVLRTHNTDSIIENKVLDTSLAPASEATGFKRAPSYKIAQTSSFDRTSRAPSYRKALDLYNETDSGLGSGDLTSSGSVMTSSSESNQSDASSGRQSSYRAATENGSKTG